MIPRPPDNAITEIDCNTQKTLSYFTGSIIVAVLSFLLVRLLFPFPDFFPDSREYLYTAMKGIQVSSRPLGYARFLDACIGVCNDFHFVVWMQFLLHLAGTLWFAVITVKIWDGLHKWQLILLLFCSVDNWGLIYLANTYFSDCLFIPLTFMWFASLLSVIFFRHKGLKALFFVLHLVFLWLALKTRYTAYYYPVVSMLTILFFNWRWFMKLICAGALAGVTFFFYVCTLQAFEKRTGLHEAQGFSGLQFANNAYEAYRRQPSARLHTSDKMLLHIDSLNASYFRRSEEERLKKQDKNFFRQLSVKYMWDSACPNYLLIQELKSDRHLNDGFVAWNQSTFELGRYGKAYIRQYPGAYLLYYLIPNNVFFFAPDIENLHCYSANGNKMYAILEQYYHLPHDHHSNFSWFVKPFVAPSYLMYSVTVILFVPLLCFFFRLKRWKRYPDNARKTMIATSWFFFGTWGFMVLSAPVMYRYVIFLSAFLVTFEYAVIYSWIKSKNTRVRRASAAV